MSIFPGPQPLYTNPPIQPEFYQPRMFFIDDITRGSNTTVTTTDDHDFVIGQVVRLIIPQEFGIRQLNGLQGIVISLPADNEVLVNIDSRFMNNFISSSGGTQPQILPIGDENSGQINSSGRVNNLTYIQGSFINISPQ